MRLWLLAFTDFGDAAVLIPLTGAILLWLLFYNSRATALWVAAVGFCVGTTAILKIFFYGCPPASDMRSPSGHTAFSFLVYGAIAFVAAAPGGSVRRLLAIGVGAGLIVTIAASRLLLDVHTLPEVGVGLVIGSVSLVVFARNYRWSADAKIWPLLLSAGVLMTVLHGQELHAEEFLHHMTRYFRIHCS
jgi:membrane-associated phospholipid phosphatase